MTQLLKNAFLSSIMSFAFISGTMSEKCERLEMYDLYVTSANIETDLVTGIWETNLTGTQSKMYFQEDGLVEIVNADADADVISIQSWSVQKKDSHFVLTITSELGDVSSVHLYPTCDGFSIRSSDGSAGNMNKIERDIRKLAQSARSQMEGVWEIISDRMPKRLHSWKWDFKSDGTFALHISPDLFHNGFQGVWDIAPDGEHIILYFARSEDLNEVYSKEVIRINNVDYEDLVLSGEALGRLTGQKDDFAKVYFEKEFQ